MQRGRDSMVRNAAGAAQKRLSLMTIVGGNSWEDIILDLPDPTSGAIGGPGLKDTIRGVMAPRR